MGCPRPGLGGMRKEEGGEQETASEAGSSSWGTQLRQRDQKVTISITGTKCRNCHTFEVTLVPTFPAQIHTPLPHGLPWGGCGDQGRVKVGPSLSARGAGAPRPEARIQATCSEPARAPWGSTLEDDTAGKLRAEALREQQPTPRLRVRGKPPGGKAGSQRQKWRRETKEEKQAKENEGGAAGDWKRSTKEHICYTYNTCM